METRHRKLDGDLVRWLFDQAKRSPFANYQDNKRLKSAAMRLAELTTAWALTWEEAVRRGFEGRPAYVAGYMDHGLETDCWALLYSPHGDPEDVLYAVVNKDLMWEIRRDDAVSLWTDVPRAEDIDQWKERRAYETGTAGA